MFKSLRSLVLAVFAASFALGVLACSDDDVAEAPADEPSAATTASKGSVPSGWSAFSEGQYSGALAPGWEPIFLDLKDVAKAAEKAKAVDQKFADQVKQIAASGQIKEVFYVFLDKDKTFATNINILPCTTAPQSKNTTEHIAEFKKAGYTATRTGTTTYGGKEAGILKVKLGSGFDTYQTVVEEGGCYSYITLSTREGDAGQVAAFSQFIAALKIRK